MTEASTPNPASALQPAAGDRCSTCASAMAPEASRCNNCGTTRGEQHRCPFCRVVAEVEPDPVMRWRCPACGAPRIPQVVALTSEGEAMVHLRKARSARSSQLAWRTAAITMAGFGVLGTLIMLGVFSIVSPGLVPWIAGLVLCAMPFVFSVLGWNNASKRTGEVTRELEQAWMLAARDLVRAQGIMPATALAEAMRIDHAQAEKIMVGLGSLDEIRTDMTESGDLAVSVRGGARVRVEAPKVSQLPAVASAQVPARTELAENPAEVVEQPVAETAPDRSGKVGA